MNIQEFTKKRPELYHLTAQENLDLIRKHKKIYSTNKIIDLSGNNNLLKWKRTRRPGHVKMNINGDIFSIRDQKPISEIALKKCLTDNWECADFYEYLNDRVFTWPTLDRLYRHYDRYKSENPVIIVLNTEEVFSLNTNPLFSRLNTGATRANSYLGGKAPERGPNTFLSVKDYVLKVGSVAEVTFANQLLLPNNFEICYDPEGERIVINL